MIPPRTLARFSKLLSSHSTRYSTCLSPSFTRQDGELVSHTPRNRRSPIAAIQRKYHKDAHEALETWESMGSDVLRENFERCQKMVENLKSSSDLSANDLNVALFCFVSHKVSLYASKNSIPEVPEECVKKLVDYVHFQFQNNGEWIQSCMRHRDFLPALTQALWFFLRPFKGTAYAIQKTGSRTNRKNMREDEAVTALQNATFVQSLITQLVEDPLQHPAMCLSFLELWKSRCWYFGNGHFRGVELNPDILQHSFGGAQGTEDCLGAMSEILHKMDNNKRCGAYDREVAYARFVAALAATGNPGAANRAREVLRMIEGRQQRRQTDIHSAVMLAYANEARFDREVAHGARELWDHICSQKHLKQKPAAFNTLLLAFSNAYLPEDAERLLLLQEQKSAKGGLRPTTIDYNVVINSWAKTRTPEAAKKALALYNCMVKLAEERHRRDVAPDAITYTALIDGLARSPHTGKEGLDLADQLLHHVESGSDPNVQADHTMYRTYMKALSIRLSRQAKTHAKGEIADLIETLLFRMKERSHRVPSSVASDWHNASMYGIVIEAWARTKWGLAPKRALDLYAMLKNEDKKAGGVDSLKPDSKLFHELLTCMGVKRDWRQGEPDRQLAHHTVSLAKGLLNDMQQCGYPLTVTTLGLYLRVLCTRGIREAIEEAESTLQSLEDDCSNGIAGVVPNSFSYQVVMEGCAKLPGAADPERAERLLNRMVLLSKKYEERKTTIFPPAACFTITMDAWTKSGRSDFVENVERILKEAEDLDVHPTAHMYTTLINAYACCDHITDGPERAAAILLRMKSDYESGKNPECKPSAAAFSAFLKCWEKSGREDAPDEIEKIVMHLHELDQHEKYRGFTVSYNSFKQALLAWQGTAESRPDAGDRALKLLQMIDEYKKAGKIEGDHALHCYSVALVTIARCPDDQKASKAYALLMRMREKSYRLRAIDFYAVLNACRETGTLEGITDSQKEEALRIANTTFHEFQESDNLPDEAVYKEMFDLHGILLDGEDAQEMRDTLVGIIFSNAPPAIQQSKAIRASLGGILSSPSYNELVSGAVVLSPQP